MSIQSTDVFYHVNSKELARTVFLKGLPPKIMWSNREETLQLARLLEDKGIEPMVIPLPYSLLTAFGVAPESGMISAGEQSLEETIESSLLMSGVFLTTKPISALTLIKAYPPLRKWSEEALKKKSSKNKKKNKKKGA